MNRYARKGDETSQPLFIVLAGKDVDAIRGYVGRRFLSTPIDEVSIQFADPKNVEWCLDNAESGLTHNVDTAVLCVYSMTGWMANLIEKRIAAHPNWAAEYRRFEFEDAKGDIPSMSDDPPNNLEIVKLERRPRSKKVNYYIRD